TLVFSIVIGFPAIGALAAWFAALRSWRSLTLGVSGGSALPEMRRWLVPLLVMPSSLIMYRLVVSLIVLGEAVPDTVALPSALSYGVPGLLAGLGTAVISLQGVRAAVASTQDFGRSVVKAGAWWPLRDLMLRPRDNLSFGLADSCVRCGLVRGNRGSGPDFVHDGQAQKASSD